MIDFIRWYLEKFGSRDFMGIWLAWMGFVTLCAIEAKRAWTAENYEPSTVFTTILGGVVGYVVGSRHRAEPPSERP